MKKVYVSYVQTYKNGRKSGRPFAFVYDKTANAAKKRSVKAMRAINRYELVKIRQEKANKYIRKTRHTRKRGKSKTYGSMW